MSIPENIKDRTIASSRLIDAPHTLVFAAFANPDSLKHWWGPKGFTSTINHFEFRPGGFWKFILHGPDGADYPNECEFKEIIEDEKIVFIHHFPVHRFTMTIRFEALDNKTLFSFTMVFDDPQEVERIQQYVVPANEENFDRLEQFVFTNHK